MFIDFLSAQVKTDYLCTLGHFADGLTNGQVLMLPLAIAVDPERLEKEKEEYVVKAILHLLHFQTPDDVKELL